MLGDMASTGFGTVTMDLGRALLDLGHDMRFLSQNDLPALIEPFASRTADQRSIIATVNPISGQLESNEPTTLLGQFTIGPSLATMVDGSAWGDWTPEALIMLGDYRAVELLYTRDPAAFDAVPSFHYCPIEGVGLPPAWRRLWDYVRPVAMSNFGADEIAKVTGQRPPMIYHGVDADVFHPVSTQHPIILAGGDRPDVRLVRREDCQRMWAAWFGFPLARRWILRTDRHMPRKRYNSMLRALAPVLAANPEWGMVIHCGSNDQGGNLYDMISKLGLRPVNDPSDERPQSGWAFGDRPYAQVMLTDTPGLVRPALVSLYNAADLYVSTSAEGFGLTVAEAAACGLPVVALDYSAVPEVVGPAGVCVPSAYLIENEYDHFWAAIDEAEFARRVEFLITHQARREDLGRKGPAHIAASFRWSDAAVAFADLLHASLIDQAA